MLGTTKGYGTAVEDQGNRESIHLSFWQILVNLVPSPPRNSFPKSPPSSLCPRVAMSTLPPLTVFSQITSPDLIDSLISSASSFLISGDEATLETFQGHLGNVKGNKEKKNIGEGGWKGLGVGRGDRGLEGRLH